MPTHVLTVQVVRGEEPLEGQMWIHEIGVFLGEIWGFISSFEVGGLEEPSISVCDCFRLPIPEAPTTTPRPGSTGEIEVRMWPMLDDLMTQ